jgi:hypothetical protein
MTVPARNNEVALAPNGYEPLFEELGVVETANVVAVFHQRILRIGKVCLPRVTFRTEVIDESIKLSPPRDLCWRRPRVVHAPENVV